MFQSRNRRNSQEFSLTHDQRLLLDVYLNFYNQTTRQIDLLYELQDEIRSNINMLVGLNSNNNTFNRNFQTNQHHGRRSNNQPNNIYQQRHASQNNTENYTSRQRQNYIEGTPYLVTMTNLLRNSYMNNQNQNQNHNQNHNQNQNETITPIWRSFYDAVQVVPTQTQIDNATRNVNYSEIETPTNNSCPITLERFERTSPVTQILYCGHIFSSTGLDSWLRTNVRCPVCRYDIREYRTRERDIRHLYSRNSNNTSNNQQHTSQQYNEQDNTDTNIEDVESNEGYEETKEEYIPNNRSSSSNQERNSNSRRHINLNDELTNILTNVTEELLNGFLRPNSHQTNNFTSSLFDPSYNSFFFDSSNNQIVFEGYMRR
jgi:hypothetical protein